MAIFDRDIFDQRIFDTGVFISGTIPKGSRAVAGLPSLPSADVRVPPLAASILAPPKVTVTVTARNLTTTVVVPPLPEAEID